MTLHVIPYNTYGKFFTEFIVKNFDKDHHEFFYTSTNLEFSDEVKKVRHQILKKGVSQYILLFCAFLKYERVILHGLFNNRHNLLLLFVPQLTKKTYWVIWGGDLYAYKHRKTGLKSNLQEYVRKLLFKRIENVIANTEGDYELLNKWYPGKYQRFESKYYLPFVFPGAADLKKTNVSILNVLIGNSSSITNNHLEVFQRIKNEMVCENVDFYVPLNYGDLGYRDTVIGWGSKIIGSNFKPIVDYIDYDEYIEFLKTIDTAIFYHDRQQAMGNIIQLLALGKKVYIRSDTTHFKSLKEKGFVIIDAYSTLDSIAIPLSKEDQNNNISLAKKVFSEETIVKQWEVVFSESRI